MKTFKLTEYTHPREIFLHQEQLRANREWATNFTPTPTPKVEIPKIEKKNLLLVALSILRP